MSEHEHSRQNTIDLCQAALDAVRDELGANQYHHATEYVSKYDEWLVGLEYAIDCLVEKESAVGLEACLLFERAYAEMRMVHDDRLRHLRELVAVKHR